MVALYWICFIVFDALCHWFIITTLKVDPTPDNKKHGGMVANIWRLTVFIGIGILSGVTGWLRWAIYTLFSYTSFLGFFGEILNKLRNKLFGYLGNGPTDRVLRRVNPYWRLVLFTTLSAILAYLMKII